MKSIKILIGGDVVPTESNVNAFVDGNEDLLFNDLIGEIQAADLAVINLECPLISSRSTIKK